MQLVSRHMLLMPLILLEGLWLTVATGPHCLSSRDALYVLCTLLPLCFSALQDPPTANKCQTIMQITHNTCRPKRPYESVWRAHAEKVSHFSCYTLAQWDMQREHKTHLDWGRSPNLPPSSCNRQQTRILSVPSDIFRMYLPNGLVITDGFFFHQV